MKEAIRLLPDPSCRWHPRTVPGWADHQGHLAADGRCRPLSVKITAGQRRDSPSSLRCWSGSQCGTRAAARPGVGRAELADRAYCSKVNRAYLRHRRITAVIPQKTDQAAARKRKGSEGSRPSGHDAELHKARYTIERCVGGLKQWLGTAIRTNKPAKATKPDRYRQASDLDRSTWRMPQHDLAVAQFRRLVEDLGAL